MQRQTAVAALAKIHIISYHYTTEVYYSEN